MPELSYNSNRGDSVEELFQALYLLQRLPECEEEAESIATKLHEEMQQFPVKKKKGEYPKRQTGFYHYYPNGVMELRTTSYSRPSYKVILPGWEEEIKAIKKKEETLSLTFLKDLSPIWYAQIMQYQKRSWSIQKHDKTTVQDALAKYELIANLPDEERVLAGYEEFKEDLAAQIRKTTSIFNLERARNKITNIRDKEPKSYPDHFFFLNDIHCELLIHAIEKDTKIGYQGSIWTDNIQEALVSIYNDTEEKAFIRFKDSSHFVEERWDYTDNDEHKPHWSRTRHHVFEVSQEDFVEHYIPQLEELDKKHLKLLKRFGLVIEPKQEVEEEVVS